MAGHGKRAARLDRCSSRQSPGTAAGRGPRRIRLTTLGTLPAGLSLATDYYVVTTGLTNTPASDWIGLSLTPGGAKVDITAASGGGTHTVTLPHELGDTFFGVVKGNGGNWIELVVIADHLDTFVNFLGVLNEGAER